jgi:hypothetical protein
MRYSGGLLGGSWLATLTSDLGAGKFDGAWLVQNFENLNPANTFWKKPYNLFSKVDTEAPNNLDAHLWMVVRIRAKMAEEAASRWSAVDLGGRVWLGGKPCKGGPAAPASGG